MRAADRQRRLRGLSRSLALLALAIAAPGTSALADALPLWQIRDADTRVWLLGSIHLLRESDYPLPGPIREAYAEADALVMELDMDDLDSAMVSAVMFSRGTPPEGETLASLMGPEDYARARRAAAAAGIDLDRLQGAEPWYAALTLTQMLLMRAGYDPRQGLDQHMAGLARRDGKPIAGLETFEEQIVFFDSLPMALQSDMLLEALAEIEDLEAGMGRTVEAWRRGDTAYLADELLEELRRYPDLYDRLVTERNRKWAPRIAALLQREGDYLVVVGALHLVGPDSVLALLAADGIPSEQMSAAPAGGD
jgi:uncharacterized protein YbaP (TraB family)